MTLCVKLPYTGLISKATMELAQIVRIQKIRWTRIVYILGATDTVESTPMIATSTSNSLKLLTNTIDDY